MNKVAWTFCWRADGLESCGALRGAWTEPAGEGVMAIEIEIDWTLSVTTS
jgi:hypothetical protein